MKTAEYARLERCDLHRDTSRTFEKLARKLWKWTKDNAEQLKEEDERIARGLEKLTSRSRAA